MKKVLLAFWPCWSSVQELWKLLSQSKSNKEQSVEASVDADLALVQGEAVAETSDAGGFDSEDWILLALWFFLGGFAAHRWYAKRPIGWNILYILTFGGLGIWAIIDLIQIINQDFM